MFKDVVNSLTTGQRVCFFPPKKRALYQKLREVEPDSFSKNGREIIFVGSKKDLIDREAEILAKIFSAGYIDPGPSKKRGRKRRQQEPNVTQLSDKELFSRIEDTFKSLDLLSEAAANLKIRSMIVSGSPGTGKTYGVLKAVKARESIDQSFYYHCVKGTISAIALYIELYRAKDGVLILDDTDEVFTDNECLQILKAATESSSERAVSYRKLSMALESEGIPTEFNFNGCVIILTNTNLEETRKNRQIHYEAIMSRAHYINAVLSTDREKIMRIRHIVETTTLLDNFLDKEHHEEIIKFINAHHGKFRELSIRTVVKLAELRAAFPEQWDVLARGTLLV